MNLDAGNRRRSGDHEQPAAMTASPRRLIPVRPLPQVDLGDRTDPVALRVSMSTASSTP